MSEPEIKICGITNVLDALAAAELGVAMIGLNFYQSSPRCVTRKQAQEIAAAVAGRVKLVGIFVDKDLPGLLQIARTVTLDTVQLHGAESPKECEEIAREFPVIRALKVDAEFTSDHAAAFACCSGLLLDTPSAKHGGSGKSFDWATVQWESVRRAAPEAMIFLAGGLHADNVAEAIAIVHPDVVDVCSGVESAKGIKSLIAMGRFVAAVRAAGKQEK